MDNLGLYVIVLLAGIAIGAWSSVVTCWLMIISMIVMILSWFDDEPWVKNDNDFFKP
ncbi:hypothetical protein ACRXID_03890 [Ligilactobacillus animalis]|uniref:TMhelix containing protein n=1 Tax=Ligilactobacillus animalis TaxID=1605 RepID=A0ABR4RQN6_9LACO|nr:hypothetical protein [Ligilactobacillus animalis]KDA46389.1 hypothetical protein Lani381_0409 [Ligilactobacillus animalis]MEE0260700.1 hypothetical protein [Ligilactobacillus animalis]